MYANFSVDLEPNKDGSLHGIRDAMEWFDQIIPCGTIFATYRIANDMPDLLAELAESHEIGVHIHPKEFGYDHDQLAELSCDQQRKLIQQTKKAITDTVGTEPISFRAGRHSASGETLIILKELGFEVDASVNVQYTDYLPSEITTRSVPFEFDTGLFELPTTFGRPPFFSWLGFRTIPNRTVTATANTLRTDKRATTGLDALRWLADRFSLLSFYMHPYDASGYHTEVPNSGTIFKRRFETLISDSGGTFLAASDVRNRERLSMSPPVKMCRN
jgi:peptidoglycan/xylan/chitin deacetylase (PgdA/CDA1 family)